MKEIYKNCIHARPTYNGIECEGKGKKVKTQDTCDNWKPKGGGR